VRWSDADECELLPHRSDFDGFTRRPPWGDRRIRAPADCVHATGNGEERERRVRLGSADAPAEGSRFSSYWERLPLTSCPSVCHSVQPFQRPQRKYRFESDGTRYALREKVRFFEPFRYDATCAEGHEER